MRLSHLLSLLSERRMGGGDTERALKAAPDGTLIGFEVEAWVPEDSKLYSPGVRATTALRGEDLDFFYDEDHFYQNGGWRQKVDEAVDEWNDEKSREWAESEWTSYLKGDETEEDDEAAARERAQDDYTQEDRDAWFADKYPSRRGAEVFAYDFDLRPVHGWETEPGPNGNNDAEIYTVGEDDSDAIRAATREKVGDALSGDTEHHWRVVADGSVEGSGPGADVEMVSPPMPASEALDELLRVFDFVDGHGMETNDTTGLHVNISVPGMVEKLDPLKLVLLMGEEHALGEFGREENTYAETHRADLLRAVEQTGELPRDAGALTAWARQQLRDQKYRTVNLGKLKSGYLEFRVAGGHDYHQRIGDVRTQVGRWLSAIASAMDPDVDRQAYLKKLTKLVGEPAKRDKAGDLDGLWAAARIPKGNLAVLRDPTSTHAELLAPWLRHDLHVLSHVIADGQASDRALAELRLNLLRLAKAQPDVWSEVFEPRGGASDGERNALADLAKRLRLPPPGK